uniref:Uncharacterized protein n=1 Tax=Amorphochlora amoebiformis TaxID=1561963 RepID=A0A7S0DDY7_9EUKA
MPGDEEQGSLYEFMQGQNSQPPYGLSRSGAPSTSHLFSQAVIGSRILSNQSAAEAKANVAMDYMDMDPKPKYILGPSAKDKATLDDINENEQEHTVLAKKMFEGEGRRDEPIIDAELRAIGIKGIPTIHTACVDGNLRLVRRLTEVRNADIEAKDILGSKPLHVASCYGHLDIITFLLEKGADVNSVDNYDSTPLVVTSDRETVKLLVSFGADINAKNVNSISAKSISLSNPYICLAIEEGQRELRKRILSTKRYIGQIQKHFIRNDLCKHWYADSSNSINRNTSHMSSGSKEMDLDTNVARSGMVSTRKRRREDAKDLGVQSSKSSKKETAVREGYDGSRGSIVVEGPVATSAVPGPPQCIADLIISFLYINAHDSKEELKGD